MYCSIWTSVIVIALGSNHNAKIIAHARFTLLFWWIVVLSCSAINTRRSPDIHVADAKQEKGYQP